MIYLRSLSPAGRALSPSFEIHRQELAALWRLEGREAWRTALRWLRGLQEVDEEAACAFVSACGASWHVALEELRQQQRQGLEITSWMYKELLEAQMV